MREPGCETMLSGVMTITNMRLLLILIEIN